MGSKIAAKFVKVMEACGYVQKLGKNSFHNYKYATAADVTEKVNAALVANGLASIVVPELIDFKDVTTAKGGIEHLATVKTTITLIDSESGETMQFSGMGSGQDSGDKAIMKAQTASLKYAWMLSLQMSTGDDPEADSVTDEHTAPTDKSPAKTSTETKPTAGTVAKPAPNSNVKEFPKTPAKSNANANTEKLIRETRSKKFLEVVRGSGATNAVVRLILDYKFPGMRLANGQFDWTKLTGQQFDHICGIFDSGQWNQIYEKLEKIEDLTAGMNFQTN